MVTEPSFPPPDSAEAQYDRATELQSQGRPDEAIVAYRQALALKPDFGEAHTNLAGVLLTLGRLDEAIAGYRQALAAGLDHPIVHYNLGNALKAGGRLDEAIAAYQRTLALEPDCAEAFNNLGNACRDRGRLDEAAAAYLQALALKPDYAEAHENLAGTLYRVHQIGAPDAAAALAEVWLRDHPDSPIARHVGAALTGRAPPARASDAYVRQTFDHFAREFDERLNDLGYRAPDLIADLVLPALPAPAGVLDILDAGCGTGLCAPLLRPHARLLVGIDLSPGMLERAKAGGLYDRLVAAELTVFLKAHRAAFDLIVAADVLCYFGDLEAVLAATAAALRSGGGFAFTVERQAVGGADHRIGPHGRYSHDEAHVRRALAAAGLIVHHLRDDALRLEGGAPVPGMVVLARTAAL